MDIAQFRYGNDNLGYLVYTANRAIAIDGGDPETITAFAGERHLEIICVTNTHSHPDHTMGNSRLLQKTGARFADCRTLSQGQVLDLGDGSGLETILTPGHTLDSVCFRGDGFLVTGDTLFNATVGNCFSGDLEAFYTSLTHLAALPGSTRIYAGHDYVEESLNLAASIDPENADIRVYREKYDPGHVVSTLADELKVNPYLRFNAPYFVSKIKEKGLPGDTAFQRFSTLMEIY